MNPLVSVAVEGRSDIGMVTTLVGYIGLDLAGSILVKNGGAKLDVIIPKLARTSVHNPWIVFRDADRHCPVELRTRLIGDRAHDGAYELRLAASMTEAWLLADEQAFAHYFDVPPAKVPLRPDELRHAKRELLRVCMSSRSARMRRSIVRSDGTAGPDYVRLLNDYAERAWNVSRARSNSPSLERTVRRLVQMRGILMSHRA